MKIKKLTLLFSLLSTAITFTIHSIHNYNILDMIVFSLPRSEYVFVIEIFLTFIVINYFVIRCINSRLEKSLFYAYHDALTDLPNRLYFKETLTNEIIKSNRHNRTLAVMFLDLDGFKKINDNHGHHVGDELLKHVAIRLKACCPKGFVARQSGDEFMIMLPNFDEKWATNVAECIVDFISKPFIISGEELTVTVCVGIGMFSKDGNDFDTLTKSADRAMYVAKRAGKNKYAFSTK